MKRKQDLEENNLPTENKILQLPASAAEEKQSADGQKKPRRNYRRPAKKQAAEPSGKEQPAAQEKAKSGKGQAKPAKPAKGKKQESRKKAEPSALEAAVMAAAQKAKNAVKGARGKAKKETRKPTVRIIPLGGLNEIGKNMTLFECQDDMFIVDCGLAFPDEEMLGVDIVIPDFTYVEKNRDKIRGLVLTHGHEDHIGGVAYLLKTVNMPVYGTALTIGLVEGKLKEHGILKKAKLNVVKAGDVVKMGCMSAEFIHVNHSIPDACGFAIKTPAGVIIHTGDFKIDYTPIEGGMIDLARFGELGSQGVLALMCESTNAERPGMANSERRVGKTFMQLFTGNNKRIIVATFASNIHRIQQIIDAAHFFGRKVAVSGRSMVNAVEKSIELGYLKIPKGVLIDIENIRQYPDNKLVIVSTGSQGEPMSALTRMSMGDHRRVTITPNDFIIISATPIPGNEKLVGRVVNDLLKLGAEVCYERMYEVHVSGHACQEELKMMIGLTKPKFFIPVHGEYKHLKKNAGLALSMGIDPKNILIGDIGQVIETDGVDMKFAGTVPAGQVMVDGLGVGDVGSTVLRDRKHLAEDGLIIVVATIDALSGAVVAGPDIVSRGFVYVREAEDMMRQARELCAEVLQRCQENRVQEWGTIKNMVKDELSRFLYNKTKRSPMILPVIMEVTL